MARKNPFVPLSLLALSQPTCERVCVCLVRQAAGRRAHNRPLKATERNDSAVARVLQPTAAHTTHRNILSQLLFTTGSYHTHYQYNPITTATPSIHNVVSSSFPMQNHSNIKIYMPQPFSIETQRKQIPNSSFEIACKLKNFLTATLFNRKNTKQKEPK